MKRIPVGLFIGGMILAFGTPVWAGWLNGWDYRQEIVIDPLITPAQLNSFPLLISISDPAHPLFTQANSSAGLDVVFTASDGTTVLPREIETYSAGATPALNAWVSTQVRAASPTRLYMYYKGAEVANSTATWDDSFTMVQHFQETPTGVTAAIKDSTTNANHGTATNGMVQVAGRVGPALDFNGSQVVNVGNSDSLRTAEVTISAWVKAETVSQWNGIFTTMPNASNGINLQMGTAQRIASLIGTGTSGAYLQSPASLPATAGDWYHVAVTHNSDATNNNRLYVNGEQVATMTRTLGYAASSGDTLIGAFYTTGGLKFDGVIDEVNVSNVARSAAWIKASYNNQADPAAYQSMQSVQEQGQYKMSGWGYRQPITISGSVTPSELNDFPVLVKLADPANPLFAHASSAQGYDVFFTAADGITRLDHDLELFRNASGSEELCAWVKTPVSSAQDTLIYMYYGGEFSGNPSSVATWDDHFVAVHHLQQDPSAAGPQMKDSTWRTNHGTTYGDMTASQQVAGKVGGALNFDGANDYVSLGKDPSLYPAEITLEAWVKSDAFGDWDGIITNKKGASDGLNLQIGTNQRIASLVGNGTGYTYVKTSWAPETDEWYHVVVTHSGTTNKLYVDGELAAEGTLALSYDPSRPLTLIGEFYDGTRGLRFDGLIDEVRISNVARSADWILANYQMMNTPGAYLTFGPELMIPEPASLTLLLLGVPAFLARRGKRRRGTGRN